MPYHMLHTYGKVQAVEHIPEMEDSMHMERAGFEPHGNGNQLTEYPVRTTIVLPMALDRNLEIYCAKVGTGKSKIIEKVLFEFLSAEGLQPDRTPKSVEVNVCY